MFRFILILFLGVPFLSNAVNFQNVMVFDEILNQHSNIRVALPDQELPPQYFHEINNDDVTGSDGFLYRYTLPAHINAHIDANGVKSVVLFENGILMHQINCYHGNIQNIGQGRISFYGNGYLYFSTSDNLPLAEKRYCIVLNNLLPMPMKIHTNCETQDADSIVYGRSNDEKLPVFVKLDEHNDFIVDRNNLVPGHYYVDFYKERDLRKTNYFYVFPGTEPLVIQILRDEGGFIDIYLTGNFGDKRIVCGSEVGNLFEELNNGNMINNDYHFMACNFIGRFYKDMSIKIITPLNKNLEHVLEIPFFPNNAYNRFAVSEYNKEIQVVVEFILPIQNPISIEDNFSLEHLALNLRETSLSRGWF